MSFQLTLLQTFHGLQPVFARGGGGGSSSGGSGGGLGLAAVGYFPAYYAANWTLKRKTKGLAILAGSIVGLIVTGLCMFGGAGFGIIVGIGAAIGVHSGVNNYLSRLFKKTKATQAAIQHAASQDPAWHAEALTSRISEVFYKFQADWSTFNVQSMRTYTSDRFYNHMYVMMVALGQLKRQNAVNNPRLLKSDIIDAVDAADNAGDGFTAYVNGVANDSLIDTIARQTIYTDNMPFTEFWHFKRQGNDWVLDYIGQATEDIGMLRAGMQHFAQQNGLYYSPDMGWLLLPQRGQLFDKAEFKNSDVNNHVIGNWNSVVVQMYTYIPRKNADSRVEYLIGQVNLPKSYGGILIRRKASGLRDRHLPDISAWRRRRQYQKVSMEWPDFNKHYAVSATDMDKVTSFELLNPGFMAYLYDAGLNISIEVVDNIVYFYTRGQSKQADYAKMLTVLQKAFKELER